MLVFVALICAAHYIAWLSYVELITARRVEVYVGYLQATIGLAVMAGVGVMYLARPRG